MRLFILTTEFYLNDTHEIHTKAFSELSDAKDAMSEDVECFKRTCGFANQKEETHDHSVCIFEDGEYQANHINWLIQEQELITDEFPIIAISRADLDFYGYDTEKITDKQMAKIACKIGDYFTEDFGDYARSAADYYNIPRKENE